MTKYTSAYHSFVARGHEVIYLYSQARELEKSDAVAHAAAINSLCRGAVVLLSARLEAYVKELGDLTLLQVHVNQVPRTRLAEQFFYYLSQDILREMRETDDPLASAKKLFTLFARDRDIWSQVGPFPLPLPIDIFNKGFSNPALKKISSYFNRFGYKHYTGDMKKRLKGRYSPASNMVDQLVAMRNKIAHGDSSATMTPLEVKDMARLVQNYCQATDLAFSTWCKASLCPIK